MISHQQELSDYKKLSIIGIVAAMRWNVLNARTLDLQSLTAGLVEIIWIIAGHDGLERLISAAKRSQQVKAPVA